MRRCYVIEYVTCTFSICISFVLTDQAFRLYVLHVRAMIGMISREAGLDLLTWLSLCKVYIFDHRDVFLCCSNCPGGPRLVTTDSR